MHPHKRDAEAIDLIDYMDILQIGKVIDAENKASIQLVIDGYLNERDKEEQVSEVAEPENGEEKPEGEEATESEENGEGEESEATE